MFAKILSRGTGFQQIQSYTSQRQAGITSILLGHAPGQPELRWLDTWRGFRMQSACPWCTLSGSAPNLTMKMTHTKGGYLVNQVSQRQTHSAMEALHLTMSSLTLSMDPNTSEISTLCLESIPGGILFQSCGIPRQRRLWTTRAQNSYSCSTVLSMSLQRSLS